MQSSKVQQGSRKGSSKAKVEAETVLQNTAIQQGPASFQEGKREAWKQHIPKSRNPARSSKVPGRETGS
jgi:hypothetical protein